MKILSEDERQRAARFRFQRDAMSWMVSRAVLRAILVKYLDVEAPAVPFRTGAWGKPELAASIGASCSSMRPTLAGSGSSLWQVPVEWGWISSVCGRCPI